MALSSGRSLHFSDAFAISCGTVTLDPNLAKVLLIRSRSTGEIFLPKGRKNVGERLEDAAIRETYEETGFEATLLPLQIPSLATPATQLDSTNELGAVTEPIAVTQRLTDNVLKIIFWFAAKGDSTATPNTGTQQDGEDFEPVWVDLDQAVPTLTFDDDRHIVQTVIDIASK